jgi:hypothetical protein
MNKLFIVMGVLLVGLVVFVYMFPSDDEIRASRVLSSCWDKELKICKDENKGDECTFGVYEVCAAKHPEMQNIFEGRLETCSERYDGTVLNNPNILECTGVKTQRTEEYCHQKHANYEDIKECIEKI